MEVTSAGHVCLATGLPADAVLLGTSGTACFAAPGQATPGLVATGSQALENCCDAAPGHTAAAAAAAEALEAPEPLGRGLAEGLCSGDTSARDEDAGDFASNADPDWGGQEAQLDGGCTGGP